MNKTASKLCISNLDFLISKISLKLFCEWMSEKKIFISKLVPNSLKYKYSANFSTPKLFNMIKIYIYSNWDVTNSYIWHFQKIRVSCFLLKYKSGTNN